MNRRKALKKLGLSLGKINYCLLALKHKGLIKINNFKKNKNKLNYLYIITSLGFVKKTKLTIKFMKQKMQEYEELSTEFENEKNK